MYSTELRFGHRCRHTRARAIRRRSPPDIELRLGVNSAVSGRPLDLPVDHQGPGEGAFNFEDDPRQYNLMVESSGLAWTIDVDEVVLVVR